MNDNRFTSHLPKLPILINNLDELKRLIIGLWEHRLMFTKIRTYGDFKTGLQLSYSEIDKTVKIYQPGSGCEFIYTEEEIKECLEQSNPLRSSWQTTKEKEIKKLTTPEEPFTFSVECLEEKS